MRAPKSKKAIAYVTLKKKIVTNALRPGEPLNETVLTKELGVSKTPIREAFQQLEMEGLVEIIPGRGAFVSKISIEDVREIFEIREIIECQVIRRAALKADPVKVQNVRKRYEASWKNGAPTTRNHTTSGEDVHSFIFETAGNRRLSELYRRLQDHIDRMRNYFFGTFKIAERSQHSFDEHLAILDTLLSNDPDKAEETLRNHLNRASEYLRTLM